MIREGFEPSTHSLEGCCSIQLSYRTMLLYRERDSNPQAEALVPKTSVSTNFTTSVFIYPICQRTVCEFPCTAYRNRTGTNITVRGILSPLCLPISPRRHSFLYLNIRRISSFSKLVQTLFDKIVEKFFVVFCKIF